MTIERHDPADSIKVVPMVIDEGPETAPVDEPTVADWTDVPKSALVGVISLVIGVLVPIATGVGVGVGSAGSFPAATTWAYVGIGLSVLAVLTGVLGVVLRRGRAEAIVGIVLGVVGNPLVLLVVLRFVGGTP